MKRFRLAVVHPVPPRRSAAAFEAVPAEAK